MAFLVTGKYVLPGAATATAAERALTNAAVAVVDDEIAAVGPAAELRTRYPGVPEIGGADYVVLPGLIDGHQHGRGLPYSQRGVADDRLELWLHDLRGGAPLHPYLGTQLAALRLLAGGVTTALHSHVTMRPDRYEEELFDSVRGYQDSGLRTTVALDLRDRAFFTYQDDDDFLAGLSPEVGAQARRTFPVRSTPAPEAVARLLPELQQRVDASRVRFALGPQAPQWCTPDALERSRALATDLGGGLHLHCAESEAQLAYFLQTYRKTPVRFLHDLGVLGPDVSLAHCVWLSPNDIELLAATDTVVVHNPGSNLRLRSGLAPVPALVRGGVTVALGTDSLTLNDDDDLFGEMRLAARLQSLPGRGSDGMTPGRWLAAATVAGARAALRPEQLGRLEPGAKADMVLLDRRALEGPSVADLPARLTDLVFQRARAAHVRTVVVGGEVMIRDGCFVRADPETLAEQLAEYAVASAPDPARRAVLRDLRTHLQDYLRKLVPAYAG